MFATKCQQSTLDSDKVESEKKKNKTFNIIKSNELCIVQSHVLSNLEF